MSAESSRETFLDANAKRAEIARIMGGRRHISELRWTPSSKIPPGQPGPLTAIYEDKQRGTAVFVGHGIVRQEDGKILFTEQDLLAFTKEEWVAFTESAKGGEFDLPTGPDDTSNPNHPSASRPEGVEMPNQLFLIIGDNGFIEPPATQAA